TTDATLVAPLGGAAAPDTPTSDLGTVTVAPIPMGDDRFSIRYQMGAELGRGAMGEVRLCQDTRIGRRVAMKLIRKGQGSTGDDARGRFVREARVQGQLEHPAVVPVYDLGVTPTDEEFFTMKRVRGQT